MKRIFYILLLVVSLSGQAQNLMDYSIVLRENHDSIELRAAQELQSYLQKALHHNLPIIHENDYQAWQKAIFLGETRWTDAEILNIDSLKDDGYLLFTDRGNLYIYGNRGKAVLYGVYHFLEHLGFRLYTPSALYVPHNHELMMPQLDEVVNPSFAYREVLYYYPNHSQLYADWHGMHNRQDLKKDWGMFVHTFRKLIPTEIYFDTHPEWFSEINGRRVKDGQLCLSNPQVLDTLCVRLAEMMDENPSATIWSVSNNDNYNVCTCEACRKLDSLYGGPSGTLIHFINQVAERFPDKTISTLGYQFTRRAPQPAPQTQRPDSNVNIMFCSIECGRQEAVATAPSEASFRKDMEDWSAITDNIFMWDYVVQFRSMMNPFPNLHILQPNLQYFHDHGVRMMFEQATGADNKTAWMELRNYLLNKLMWNVDVNVDSIIHDFCSGYYGGAASEVEAILQECHKSLIASGQRLDIYGYPINGVEGYLSPDQIKKYQSYFAQARTHISTPEEKDRLRYLELSFDYAILELAMSEVSEELTFFNPDRTIRQSMLDRADAFVQDCERFGVGSLVEMGRSPEQFRADIDNFLRKSSRDNLAYKCPVSLRTDADSRYYAKGAQGLTDGVCGLLNYNYNWLGFYGTPMEAVVDLKARKSVQEISLDFFFLPLSWIFVPQQVDFYISNNGKSWKLLGSQKGHNPVELARPDIHTFKIQNLNTKGRYVKIVATPLPQIPDWHRATGNPCWIFTDEIIIKG